jgi:S1-C subfamily serine protease
LKIDYSLIVRQYFADRQTAMSQQFILRSGPTEIASTRAAALEDMGQAPSQEELDSVGYRVLGVQPNSPAATAGLVSFFDFVVAANSCPLKVLDQKFVDMIKDSEDKPLPLTIYNIKSETTRDVVITPRRGWGGQGMLGVTIRFDSFWRAEEALVRVLEVVPESPAELAGLEAEKDYLLGTAEKVFKDTDALYEEVREGERAR